MTESFAQKPIYALAEVVRDTVEPATLHEPVVHYSIPALEQTGRPAVEDPADIKSLKLRLQGNELLVSRLNPRKGRVLLTSSDERVLVASTEFVAFRERPPGDLRFLRWCLSSETTRQALDAEVRSATRSHQRVDPEVIGHLKVPAPPLAEQRRIADFLDGQVALLDETVSLRQQQMSMSAERIRANEYAAVLGLNELGTRSPVGTDWIGSVPAGWTVQPLGRLFSIELGKMLAPDRVSGEHLRPYLRNTNVQWDRIDTHDLLSMNFPPEERARYEVLPGDLLVCEGGESGRAAIWDGSVSEVYYQKALHRLRPKARVSVRWVYYVLRVTTQLGVFTAAGGGTTIAHLTGEQLKAHRMPFAPLHVQERLVMELDEAAANEAQLRSLHGEQVALLTERKRSLITAAVTGQFDVATARSVA